MAFYLGIMNEEEKKYETALKFYKKYFLTAKLLQDIYGTELALNRIAVLFGNIFDYSQSIYYNEKHKEITTHNLNGFVSYYNCGVCYRILENFPESLRNFESALKLSEEENDLESYTLCLAQLAITHIFMGNVNAYMEHSEEFFNKNKSLNHVEMELEMQVLSGYIYNYVGNLEISKDFYKSALSNSLSCENEKYKAVSLCNIGIINANKDFDLFMDTLCDPKCAEKMMNANDEENEGEDEQLGENENNEGGYKEGENEDEQEGQGDNQENYGEGMVQETEEGVQPGQEGINFEDQNNQEEEYQQQQDEGDQQQMEEMGNNNMESQERELEPED